MQNVLKPFGEKDTDLSSGMFVKTRIALTVLYVVILAVILMSSSGISKYIFSERLQDRFEETVIGEQAEKLPPPHPDMENIRDDFQKTIFFVNGLLLLFAGLLSYGLAGWTLRPIKRSYERQRQFLSDASHELRTPLAILQTGLETQLRKSKQSADQEVIQSHLEEVERMTQLVNDLLQLSHLAEDGGKTALTAPVDISTLVQVTTDRFSQLADKHKVRLEVELPEDESVFIKGDKALLSHAIANVINNAVLYNKKNGRVSVRLFKKSAEAVIEIEDTGIGMSDEDVACAFDRFYRAEKSRARCSGGSGLGLSIVLAIVRAHNGRVKIQSTHDQGTIVRINLSLLETE